MNIEIKDIINLRERARAIYAKRGIEGKNTHERYLKAQSKAKYCKTMYYRGEPVIEDVMYDMMEITIELMEEEHPEWITSDSITQIVGYKDDNS